LVKPRWLPLAAPIIFESVPRTAASVIDQTALATARGADYLEPA